MNELKCEKCGSKMFYKIDGHTQGWYCPSCNWSIVTTYFSDMELDETIYKIELLPDANATIDKIRLISKIGNLNFILSKKILNDGGLLVEGPAKNIDKKIKELDLLKVFYKIIPNYPYK